MMDCCKYWLGQSMLHYHSENKGRRKGLSIYIYNSKSLKKQKSQTKSSAQPCATSTNRSGSPSSTAKSNASQNKELTLASLKEEVEPKRSKMVFLYKGVPLSFSQLVKRGSWGTSLFTSAQDRCFSQVACAVWCLKALRTARQPP